MKCPVCKDVTLLMMEKKWIEIDYCPECRWVWLDRWELEKLIQAEKSYDKNTFESDSYDEQKHQRESHRDSHKDYANSKNPPKKRSFLDWFDLFD